MSSAVSSLLFNARRTTDIYPLSLHDALPISLRSRSADGYRNAISAGRPSASGSASPKATATFTAHFLDVALGLALPLADRKSTRLNSSHLGISYAVFCLKKKTHKILHHQDRT